MFRAVLLFCYWNVVRVRAMFCFEHASPSNRRKTVRSREFVFEICQKLALFLLRPLSDARSIQFFVKTICNRIYSTAHVRKHNDNKHPLLKYIHYNSVQKHREFWLLKSPCILAKNPTKHARTPTTPWKNCALVGRCRRPTQTRRLC